MNWPRLRARASSQASLQSALMAARLRNVTQLELLNHYLNSGSMMLIKGNVNDGRQGWMCGPDASALSRTPHDSGRILIDLPAHEQSSGSAGQCAQCYSAGYNIELTLLLLSTVLPWELPSPSSPSARGTEHWCLSMAS